MANKKNKNGALITLAAASAAAVAAGLLMLVNKNDFDKSKKTVRVVSPDGEKKVLVEYGRVSLLGGIIHVKLTAEREDVKCLCRSFLSAPFDKNLLFVWRDNDNLTIHFPNIEGEEVASVCFNESGCTKINFVTIKNGRVVSEDVLTKK